MTITLPTNWIVNTSSTSQTAIVFSSDRSISWDSPTGTNTPATGFGVSQGAFVNVDSTGWVPDLPYGGFYLQVCLAQRFRDLRFT